MGTGFEVEKDEFGAVATEAGACGVGQLLATVQHQLFDVEALLSDRSVKRESDGNDKR